MRLAIIAGCLITLILVSRWYTLSEKPESAETNTQVANSLPVNSTIADSTVAPAIFDQPMHRTAEAQQVFARTLGSNAKNTTNLVRAEYLIPKQAGKVLMEFESQTILEIRELPCEDPEMARIEVTTHWQGQKAMCDFLSAFCPLERMQCAFDETSFGQKQMQSIEVAVD